MEIFKSAGELLNNIERNSTAIIEVTDIKLYHYHFWINFIHHDVKYPFPIEFLAEFKIVVMIAEFHIRLDTEFTTFIENVKVLIQVVLCIPHFFIHPWTYHILLLQQSGVLQGVFPGIGKILFNVIPVI